MPETRAYLRFTAGEPTTWDSDEVTFDSPRRITEYGLERAHAVASRADLRDGTWHEADLVDYPDPETGFPDEFGLPNPARIRMAVRDRAEEGRSYKDLDAEDQVESVNGFVELVKEIEQEDGTSSTFTYPRQMVITGTERREGRTELELTDRLGQALDQLYPTKRYTADTHPDLVPDYEGRIIPYTVATANYPARHVPGAIIAFDETTGETEVSFGEPGGGSLPAVYRGTSESRALVDPSEYTVVTKNGELVAVFPAKQKDNSNRFYVFSADRVGTDSANAADELKRILELHNMTVQAAGHSTLQSLATTWNVDEITCDYGNPAAGESGQRQVRAIVRDLLRILRSGLDFDGDGEVVPVPDQQQASSGDYVNGSSGIAPGSRRCRIHPMPRKARRKTITGLFGVNPQDPGKPAWPIERTVPTGRAPEGDPTRVRYLHKPAGADALVWYWAMLEEYNREGRLELWDIQRAVGDVLTLTHDALWTGTRQVVLRSRRARPLGDEHRVREYHDDIHTYVAGTLPTGPSASYSKDFSGTNPDAPTSLTNDSEGVTQNNEGIYNWHGTFTATPPAENFEDILFVAVETASGAIGAGPVEGTELGNGDYEVTIGGLATNVEYRIDCYARNRFGLRGAVTSLTLTTTTDAGAPPTPTSVSISQKTTLYGEVSITANEPPDFLRYEYQIWSPGSTSWGATRKLGNKNTDIFPLQNYVSGQKIRVRMVDDSENEGGWKESNTINPSRNIGNADIEAGGVHTENVEDSGITTPKRQGVSSVSVGTGVMSPGTMKRFSPAISSDKAPVMVGGAAGAPLDHMIIANAYDASAFNAFMWAYRPSTASSGLNAEITITGLYW